MTEKPPFRRILIANRGEIALRVIRTAREMGIETVAVYSDADRNSLHVRRATRAVCIGPAPPAESYLSVERILAAAKRTCADAIHPGYGFLSESAAFARACAEAGIEFLGPPAEAISAMGDKVRARGIALSAGVPLVPGLEQDTDEKGLVEAARRVGFPVMLKAAAGGGGKGIRIVAREKDLLEAFRLARAEAKGAFGDDRVYLEKLVEQPRHVEIQILADRHGNVAAYGERECSVQRRHQKLVEESPCAALTPELRGEMEEAARRLAKAAGYFGAGTVEFLFSKGRFYFLEMNTRLQVEHPVTEMRYGVDLVREQVRIGAGARLGPVPEPRGHAIEVRINAEDPRTFMPSLGRIERISVPGGPGVRLDSMLYSGLVVTPHYDSMLGKLIVHAEDRARAIARCARALQEFRIAGVSTSLPTALAVLRDERFLAGNYDTSLIAGLGSEVEPEREELMLLAAVAARFLKAEQAGALAAERRESASSITPAWGLLGRAERVGRRIR
ncbi:MAG: acetyl-CoA carboxylase biotin carboxylase subunit [Planctomycetota bacterium]